MHIAIWTFTLMLIGLWTVAAWALASVLGTDGAWLSNVGPWLTHLPFGGWIETVWPTWLEAAHALLGLLHNLLAWLGGAVPLLVWLVWGAGTFAFLLVGAGLSLIVVLVRKTMPPAQPPQPPTAAAA
jgi:hypothetical protein